ESAVYQKPVTVRRRGDDLVPAVLFLWYGGESFRKRCEVMDFTYGLYHIDIECLGRRVKGMETLQYTHISRHHRMYYHHHSFYRNCWLCENTGSLNFNNIQS